MIYQNFEMLLSNENQNKKKNLIVAGAHDEHTLEAVLRAREAGVADCTLVGDPKGIVQICEKLNGGQQEWVERVIVEANTPEEAAKKSVALIAGGKGDVLIKGKMETGTLLKEVVNKETGIGSGRIMSHLAILQIPSYHKLLAFTDGGMLLYPTLEEKEAIVNNAVTFFHELGYECPKVAALAAVENINPKMQETLDGAKMKELCKEGRFGKCILEGPISFDLAVSKESAKIKGYSSEVCGDVDIMLVPDIATGNIVSKALIQFAGAVMAGCVLGAKVPIVLTSRGASFEEKYYSILLCASLSK